MLLEVLISLTITENVKFLGLHLDCNRTWKSHTDNPIKKNLFYLLHVEKIIIYCKCKNVTYGLYRTFRFTNQLRYNFLQFSSLMRNVFIIKKGAIRIMLRLVPRSSCQEESLKKSDIQVLTVPCVYIIMPSCFFGC